MYTVLRRRCRDHHNGKFMIDIHSHIVPLELPFARSGDSRWPTNTLVDGRGRVEIDGQVFRVVRDVAWNMEARLEEMQRVGVSTQAISPMPELFSYWAPSQDGRAFCGAMNDWIAERVRTYPDAFVGLGIVPLQDVDQACTMLSEVAAAGLAGVEVGSNIAGLTAGHARFLPFYVEAERLGLCVFVHSFHSLYEKQIPSWAVNGVTFPIESGFAAEAIIVNGILDAAPKSRIALSHGGGSAAFAISRLHHMWSSEDAMKEHLPYSPMHYLRRMYYDSIVFSEAALQYLISIVGWTQVCVGTDHPFFPMRSGIDPVLGIEVAEELRAALLDDNARRYLGLSDADIPVAIS